MKAGKGWAKTSAAWALGMTMNTLYVTTARDELSAEQLAREPLAGSVFAFEPGVTGCVKPRFAG